MSTKSTPFGSVESPINPITSAIMNGATFVARGYSGDVRQLTGLIKMAVDHKGFSIIDVFSPCVTFNLDNTHQFFKDRITKLEDEEHDPSDWKTACEKAMQWGDSIYTGLFYQRESVSLIEAEPVLSKEGPLSKRPLGLSQEQADRIIQRMM
jgi:2-oxoglutarate ferredoxin oxidoreductase subunit beta